MAKQRSLAEIGACPECRKPFVKDWKKSTGNVYVNTPFTGKTWDGHTYRASCDCMNPNLRFSIG
jgi:hypothetical protein